MNTFHILTENNLQRLQTEIVKLNKKAVKLNLPEIKVEVLSTSFEKEPNKDLWYKISEVSVSGDTPEVNGWEFTGVLQHQENGNIIRSTFDNIPDMYRTSQPNCIHCGLNRKRKDTYLIKRNNEWAQVGKTCLKDFTGGNVDPHALASYLEMELALIEGLEKEWGGMNDRGGSGKSYCKTEWYVQYVAMEIRENGWVSRSSCGYFNMPTSELAMERMENPSISPTQEDKDIAELALEWIREDVSKRDDNNNYMGNLVVSCEEDYITDREVGLVASLISAYKRDIKEKDEKPAIVKPSNYVGTIKKRMTLTGLNCTKTICIDSFYTSYLHKFEDNEGNQFVWFSSSVLLDEDKSYQGKATVKEHSEYNGVKQTVLTRCKFESVE